MKKTLASLFVAAFVAACGSSSPTPAGTGPALPETTVADAAPEPEPAPPPADASPPDAAPAPDAAPPPNFALVVSFTSPGDGTDAKAAEKLAKLVKAQKKPELVVVSRPWGREGEHDECFALTELTPAKAKAFVAKVKKELASSKKTTITENAPCHE